MALNQDIPARDDGSQSIQFYRQRLSFDGNAPFSRAVGAGAFVIGKIRAGGLILPESTGVDVLTVGNFGTNNRFQIGVAGAVSRYGLNLSATTLGFVPIAVAIGHRVDVDTDILVTPDFTGTAGTTGDFLVRVAFMNPN